MTARNILKLSELRSETDLINPDSGYDLIFLNDFMIDANIGVYKHEKIKSQPLRINIIAKVKNPKKIKDTIKKDENSIKNSLSVRNKLYMPVQRENKIKLVKISSGVKVSGF